GRDVVEAVLALVVGDDGEDVGRGRRGRGDDGAGRALAGDAVGDRALDAADGRGEIARRVRADLAALDLGVRDRRVGEVAELARHVEAGDVTRADRDVAEVQALRLLGQDDQQAVPGGRQAVDLVAAVLLRDRRVHVQRVVAVRGERRARDRRAAGGVAH